MLDLWRDTGGKITFQKPGMVNLFSGAGSDIFVYGKRQERGVLEKNGQQGKVVFPFELLDRDAV